MSFALPSGDKARIERRFWAKVDRRGVDECWEWQGCRGRGRCGLYGQFTIKRQRLMAHRVAYELTYGPVEDGLIVRHRCDNPPCCNPGHLEAGTLADNSRDMVERGRAPDQRGEKSSRSKLTESQVIDIRRKYAGGDYSLKRLGEEYGVHLATIHVIVTRKSWSHLSDSSSRVKEEPKELRQLLIWP